MLSEQDRKFLLDCSRLHDGEFTFLEFAEKAQAVLLAEVERLAASVPAPAEETDASQIHAGPNDATALPAIDSESSLPARAGAAQVDRFAVLAAIIDTHGPSFGRVDLLLLIVLIEKARLVQRASNDWVLWTTIAYSQLHQRLAKNKGSVRRSALLLQSLGVFRKTGGIGHKSSDYEVPVHATAAKGRRHRRGWRAVVMAKASVKPKRKKKPAVFSARTEDALTKMRDHLFDALTLASAAYKLADAMLHARRAANKLDSEDTQSIKGIAYPDGSVTKFLPTQRRTGGQS